MSGFYPYNPALGQTMQSDVEGEEVDRAFIAHIALTAAEAVAASATGVHAAVTDTGVAQTVTTGITNPGVPRNISATSGGVAGDIKDVQVIITGTDMEDAVITETLPVFTENSATTVVGSKAFKTVTSIYLPVHDGTGATVSIGWGDKIGLPFKKAVHFSLGEFLNNVKESTAATFAASATVLSSNTMDLHSALNGTAVDAFLVV